MPSARQGQRSARARLLAAAEELFYAHGIASTGVDAVVNRAGVATASLYKNFSGKDELIVAYLQARDERWREHWESCIAEEADPEQRVLALFTATHRWDAGPGLNRGCAQVAASVQLPADHPGRTAARAHKQHLRDRLEQLVADAGIPAPHDFTADLLVIYEGMHGLLAMGLDPEAITRAHRLAQRRLSDELHGIT